MAVLIRWVAWSQMRSYASALPPFCLSLTGDEALAVQFSFRFSIARSGINQDTLLFKGGKESAQDFYPLWIVIYNQYPTLWHNGPLFIVWEL